MNVLEKILEEIKIEYNALFRHANKDYFNGIADMYLGTKEIIRSHMNDDLGGKKCSDNHNAFVVKNMTAEQFKELTKNQNSFKKAMERFNRNKGCMVYEVDSNALEDVKPVSREFLEECAEVARKYKKNTD